MYGLLLVCKPVQSELSVTELCLCCRCLASTVWMMSPSTAITCSHTGAPNQSSGPWRKTLPTATTFSTCMRTSWSSTISESESFFFQIHLGGRICTLAPQCGGCRCVLHRCFLQGARTQHLPVPTPLWGSWINHAFGLRLRHI